jgi:two-component system sensor histidine kinase KdpD
LIENATKYAAAGTQIDISACQEGDNLRVEVADRGPGVPAADLPRLFEPFYRAQAHGPKPKGTGLGLAVAKGLVEAHGGRIWAANRQGGGARFVFTLPIGASDREALEGRGEES